MKFYSNWAFESAYAFVAFPPPGNISFAKCDLISKRCEDRHEFPRSRRFGRDFGFSRYPPSSLFSMYPCFACCGFGFSKLANIDIRNQAYRDQIFYRNSSVKYLIVKSIILVSTKINENNLWFILTLIRIIQISNDIRYIYISVYTNSHFKNP